jgi:hypothetical protein
LKEAYERTSFHFASTVRGSDQEVRERLVEKQAFKAGHSASGRAGSWKACLSIFERLSSAAICACGRAGGSLNQQDHVVAGGVRRPGIE